MANNPNLYNAVIAGATGGNQQRWLTDTVQANYESFQTSIIALASAVDTAVEPVSGDINTAQAALMQSIVQGVFANRFIQSNLQDSYESIVGPIVALWNELKENLDPVASTTITPLSLLYWTDPNTEVAEEDQNGAINAPFSVLQNAYDAAYLASVELGIVPTLILQSATYVGDIEDVNGVAIGIQSIGESNAGGFGNIGGALISGNLISSVATYWLLRQTTVESNISTSQTAGIVVLNDSLVFGTIVTNGLVTYRGITTAPLICGTIHASNNSNIYDVTFSVNGVAAVFDDSTCGPIINTLGTEITVTLRYSTCQSIAGVKTALIHYSTCGTITDLEDVTADFSSLADIDITGTANLQDCSFEPNSTVSCADLVIDTITYERALVSGVTFNISGNITFSDLGDTKSFIGWNLVTPSPLTFELLPAGHAPGFYLVSMSSIVRAPTTTTGAYNRALQYSAPIIGAAQIPAGAGVNLNVAIGTAQNLTPWTVYSSGVAAMIVTFNVAVAPTGTPLIDFYTKATLIGT